MARWSACWPTVTSLDTDPGRPQEVRFYRKMSTSSGHQHKVAIGTVWFSPAIKEEEVSAAAIRSFERDHNIGAWTQLADGYEVIDQR